MQFSTAARQQQLTPKELKRSEEKQAKIDHTMNKRTVSLFEKEFFTPPSYNAASLLQDPVFSSLPKTIKKGH